MEKNQNADKAELYSGNRAAVGDRLKEYMKEHKLKQVDIIEKYGTQYNFAKALGLSEHSLSNKLNNRVSWKTNEIAHAMDLLDLDKSKVAEYFFDEKVQN